MTNERTTHVKMAELAVEDWEGEEAAVLKTTLGSCVGVFLLDSRRRVAGLAHIMLPTSIPRDPVVGKYADTAIPTLVRKMEERGCDRRAMRASLVGGARMFDTGTNGKGLSAIGDLNVAASKKILASLGIPVVFEETGGAQGRTVRYDSREGEPQIHLLSQPGQGAAAGPRTSDAAGPRNSGAAAEPRTSGPAARGAETVRVGRA
jgi:chemotaxis protein CheD